MSQITTKVTAASMGAVITATGDSGGAVSPDGAGNIDILGGTGIITTGNPGTNTITIDGSGLEAITYDARTGGATYTKGTLVNINGYDGGAGVPLVTLADADASNSECHGMVLTTMDASTTGQVQIVGRITGVDTSTFTNGALLYLSATAGSYTINPPAGETSIVQSIGVVEQVDASGSIILNVPLDYQVTGNLDQHNIFVGNSGNQAGTTALSDGVVTYATGTGLFLGSMLTQNAILYGGSSNAISSTGVGTDGQLIIGATAGSPAYASLTSTDSSITFIPGANSLDLSALGTGLVVETLTGDSGGAIGPDGVGDIDITGGDNITTTGAANAITFAVSGTTNHAVQIGNASGSLTSVTVGTDGQVLIAATGSDPSFSTITSSTGTISFTTGANSLDLNVIGGGITWNEETGTSAGMAVNNGYIANNAALVTLTLPASASIGDVIRVSGKGAGGWRVAQNAGQTIYFGTSTTTTGATGRLDSTEVRDSIELVCVTANNDWNVLSSVGNITVT